MISFVRWAYCCRMSSTWVRSRVRTKAMNSTLRFSVVRRSRIWRVLGERLKNLPGVTSQVL
ncbi:MAG: hypothetical protein A3I72_11435 [Candidatus Tectomicrobia bacterium RIFCSPLOWO2_02_FULL_70_19]|nr:MAG: hypothetical protein A3I72_11435 [Candidatus Tectomicrobia bacterium RIFCSPLOWO2_02_FULL_70_19]